MFCFMEKIKFDFEKIKKQANNEENIRKTKKEEEENSKKTKEEEKINLQLGISNDNRNWVHIPHKWLQSLEIKTSEKWIIVVLKSYKNKETGLICPTERMLANDTGYSLKWVWKLIKKLEKKRIITIIKKGKCHHYRINI